MSTKMSSSSLLLLRKSRRLPPSRHLQIECRRAFNASPKSFVNEEKSFRGQLYESTARRIQAQREAEARFASMAPVSAFSRNSMLTFSMQTSAAETSTADSCSAGFHGHPKLLAWKHEAWRSVAIIHYTSIIYGSERTEAQYLAYKTRGLLD